MSLKMPMVDMGGVHDTLKFHDIPSEVGDKVAAAFKEHGHHGVEEVMDELRRLPDDQKISDRHLDHVQRAIEKHTSTEEGV